LLSTGLHKEWPHHIFATKTQGKQQQQQQQDTWHPSTWAFGLMDYCICIVFVLQASQKACTTTGVIFGAWLKDHVRIYGLGN
jgi:hypothetical protein